MAVQTPKQGPDYRLELSKLVNGYLAVLEWSPARLAKMSGQSKATISRITSYDTEREPLLPAGVKDDTGHCPGAGTHIRAAAGASFIQRSRSSMWDEAAEHGYTVDETNDLLHGRASPF